MEAPFDVWRRWGWIRPREDQSQRPVYSFNLRRQLLDPMLRRLAADTPGVELFMGVARPGGQHRRGARSSR